MVSRRPTSIIALSLVLSAVLLLSGCSGSVEETNQETGQGDFEEGTLSSNNESETTSGALEGTNGASGELLVRVEGANRTSFSGLCTVRNREYVISGSPSKTYSFEDGPISCRIKKRDSGGGNLKVTLVSGDSTRSVQQTNAQGGTVDVSNDPSEESG